MLLPDDIIHERTVRTVHPRELRRMMDAFRQLGGSSLVAMTSIPKSKMLQCGVVKTTPHEVMPGIRPIVQLVEKPHPTDPICCSAGVAGIVGRYLLHSNIFDPLRTLHKRGKRPIHLTDALEHLRCVGHDIYGVALEAARHDVGEVLGQADNLLRDASELLS